MVSLHSSVSTIVSIHDITSDTLLCGETGVSFIGLQCLSYLGYIQIDYLKVSKDAQAVLDADRDGKLSEKDFVLVWKKFVDIMSFNVPGAGGFVVGLLIGIRAGN